MSYWSLLVWTLLWNSIAHFHHNACQVHGKWYSEFYQDIRLFQMVLYQYYIEFLFVISRHDLNLMPMLFLPIHVSLIIWSTRFLYCNCSFKPPSIVTIVERASRYTAIIKVSSKESDNVCELCDSPYVWKWFTCLHYDWR